MPSLTGCKHPDPICLRPLYLVVPPPRPPLPPVQNIPHGMPRRFERAAPGTLVRVRGSFLRLGVKTRRGFGVARNCRTHKAWNFATMLRSFCATPPTPPPRFKKRHKNRHSHKNISLNTFQKAPSHGCCTFLFSVLFHSGLTTLCGHIMVAFIRTLQERLLLKTSR